MSPTKPKPKPKPKPKLTSQPKLKPRIALVGNGPISLTDRRRIAQFREVVRFNDTKNYLMGERVSTLVVRVNRTGLSGTNQQSKLTAPVDLNQVQQIVIIGSYHGREEFIEQFQKNYLHKEIIFLPNVYRWPGRSLSSGSRMIKYYLDQGYHPVTFGMNWNGTSQYHTFEQERAWMWQLHREKKITIHPTSRPTY